MKPVIAVILAATTIAVVATVFVILFIENTFNGSELTLIDYIWGGWLLVVCLAVIINERNNIKYGRNQSPRNHINF